ncbi:hypothetical protein [Acinetobacter baumannii]|uniref:hypothetical protein n=1 Tax=Acinetobacter baumannii TaxID=470 RepID=UPI0027B8C31C|nr:hypothetical protein [Acinetobacter baumannii]
MKLPCEPELPFCHLNHVMLIEVTTQQSNTTLSSLVNPTTLGALGSIVTKSFNLPLIVGGIAGTVLGRVLNSFTGQSTPQFLNFCFARTANTTFPIRLLHSMY